jgi:nicotinamidase-related amidase
MKTLIVVDMQPAYVYEEGFNDKILVENVKTLLKEFIGNCWPIIIVEYEQAGKTVAPVMSCLKDYSNVFFVEKDNLDGSKQVLDIIEKFNLPQSLNVCGVYSDQCVKATMRGLVEKGIANIEYYENCVSPFSPSYDFNTMCLGALRCSESVLV